MSTRTLLTVPSNLVAFMGNPNYRTNQEAARHEGFPVDECDCCVLCGKKAVQSGMYVYLTGRGEYTKAGEGEKNDDLGLYPVGSDCAKKLKKAGVTLYDHDFKSL